MVARPEWITSTSRPGRGVDPPEKVGFGGDHRLKVAGGMAGAEVTNDVVYLAIAVRNVGSGISVLDRWDFSADDGRWIAAVVRHCNLDRADPR